MSHLQQQSESVCESVCKEYILDVRIIEYRDPETDDVWYRFEAPEHRGESFDDIESAELYAAVYFDVNGFQEKGTGDRGVPPEIIQAGKDTLAAYFLTQPTTDIDWIASFYGKKPHRIKDYISWVQERAEKIRERAKAHNITE